MKTEKTNPICYLQVNDGRWCQEHYDSTTRHAAIRARELRRGGYIVRVSALGPQVTSVGVCRMTMVDIRPGDNANTFCLPDVRVERI